MVTFSTVFFFGKELVQVVLCPEARTLPWEELPTSHTYADDLWAEFLKSLGPELSVRLNGSLHQNPPFRLTFYSGGTGVQALVLSIHHSLFDGISLPNLLTDVEKCYLGQDREESLPTKNFLAPIYLVDLERASVFWSNMFFDYDWKKRSLKHPSSTVSRTLSSRFKTRYSSLQARAANEKISLQSLLMTAYGYLLATRLYKDSDITFGVRL